jgi:ribose transport system substrate-binding protein
MRRLLRGLPLLLLLMAGALQAQTACIGVISAGGGTLFWREVEQGALRAGRELGVRIYFRGPGSESEPLLQAKLIRVVEDMSCEALVLAPNVPERAEDVARLRANGIPTVYIDRDYGNAPVLGVYATDNFRAGELAGERMATLLGPGGRVLLLRMSRGVASTDAREAGFVAAAQRHGLSIVAEAWIGSAIRDARTIAADALKRAHGQIDAVFTPNEATTQSALAALRNLDLLGKVKVIGFDFTRDFETQMQVGALHGVVVQRPREMGYLGVKAAFRAARGEAPVVGLVDTGAYFVGPGNLQEPLIQEALSPYLRGGR